MNQYYEILCNTAELELAQGNVKKAIETAHQACGSAPHRGRAYRIIAEALIAKEEWLSALETYELAWLLDPTDADASSGVKIVLGHLRGNSSSVSIDRPLPELAEFGYYSKACHRFLRIKLLAPAQRAGRYAQGENSNVLIKTAIMDIDAALCNWDNFQEHAQYFYDYADPKKYLPPTSPWLSLCFKDDPELHLAVAQKFTNDHAGHRAVTSRKLRPLGKLKNRPRIGYLSADFHDHATSRLMVGMLEAHNREAWEIVGLSYGPDDGSSMQKRVRDAFEVFVNLRHSPVQENIKKIKSLDLDILVDTKGFTGDFEMAYSSSRPAPVVVNFLAYPGSMGSTAYDYIIGDRMVTPFDHQKYFSECIAQMPNAYQPNDYHRFFPSQIESRSKEGLPENALVLAAFNNTRKITPDNFQCWMRILQNLPQAVLWLYCDDAITERNLRTSAQQAGIPAERIVFAKHLPEAQHLARHQLADIFLDTFPCNAHTTASDALWMGLPVVTIQGQSFASRVAGSLLNAMKLPQLIAQNVNEYEQLILNLAAEPQRLNDYKNHLKNYRKNSALFNSEVYAKNIEQAYSFMIDRSRKGKAPHSFEVRDINEGGGFRLAGGGEFKNLHIYSKK
jgi:predicted O-linked N-acetylglucosamine transferase (SPINDLY family)